MAMLMRRDLFDLTGRIAIVTGAASGLGEAISYGLAAFGADIVAADIETAGLVRVCDNVKEMGRKALPVTCDVRSAEEIQSMVARGMDTFSRIDVLVNNAGISRRALAEEMTRGQWDEVLAVDLTGPFLCCQEVGRIMIRQGGGRIINIASVAGIVGLKTGNANYCAAKGGLISMTRALALEWTKHNILVNAVAPTHIRTPLIEALLADAEKKAYFLGNVPLGRLGEVNEIVGPVVFLASDAASLVTGTVLCVDGGHTAQ
jgi:NAD(P)-dependent dehydrogenase (short-subunit alcohol dehydrogenase family)